MAGIEGCCTLGRGFPWWIVVLAVLLVIFVFTAYAGAPAGPVGR